MIMKWFLFLILASLPVYQIRFQIFGLPTTLLEVMIIILFVIWLIKKLKNKDWKLEIGNWGWLILVWLVIGLIAVFISPDKWLALGHWRAYFLEPIIFLIIFLDLVKTEKDLNFVFYSLGLSALFCSIWAIGQKIFGGGMMSVETWQYPLKPTWRATGPFPHSNFLGLYLGPLSILFFGQFITKIRKKIIVCNLWLIVFLLSITAIIFARSEGAILGIFAALIFLAIVYQKTRKWTIFILAILIFFIFVISIICVNPRFNLYQSAICKNKMSAYFLEKITFKDLSLQLRLNIWQGTWQMIKTHPFFGVGLRGYQKLIANYQQPFFLPGVKKVISNEFHPYPHNLFLTLWAELGILGLIIFLTILIKFFHDGFHKIIQTIRTYPNTPNIFHFSFLIFNLSAMVSLLIHGAFDTPYFKNDLAVLFWLIVGLMIVGSRTDF